MLCDLPVSQDLFVHNSGYHLNTSLILWIAQPDQRLIQQNIHAALINLEAGLLRDLQDILLISHHTVLEINAASDEKIGTLTSWLEEGRVDSRQIIAIANIGELRWVPICAKQNGEVLISDSDNSPPEIPDWWDTTISS